MCIDNNRLSHVFNAQGSRLSEDANPTSKNLCSPVTATQALPGTRMTHTELASVIAITVAVNVLSHFLDTPLLQCSLTARAT